MKDKYTVELSKEEIEYCYMLVRKKRIEYSKFIGIVRGTFKEKIAMQKFEFCCGLMQTFEFCCGLMQTFEEVLYEG